MNKFDNSENIDIKLPTMEQHINSKVIDYNGCPVINEMFAKYCPNHKEIHYFKSDVYSGKIFDLDLILKDYSDEQLVYKGVTEDVDKQTEKIETTEIVIFFPAIERLVNVTTRRLYILSTTPIQPWFYESLLKYRENKNEPKQFLFYTIGLSPNNDLICNKFKISTNYKIDIDLLYNNDFKEKHKTIFEFIHNDSSGLIILSGVMGSGKTSYLRYLIAENHNKEFIIINNSMLNNLTNPEFIDFLNDHQGCILILEDCEQALKDRSLNPFENSVANILNLTDGLLADAFKIKMICTFNTNLKDIDPALTRKGRLITKYEFKELDAHKVAKLNELHNLNISDVKPMTLANIFNYAKENNEQQTKLIGYGV